MNSENIWCSNDKDLGLKNPVLRVAIQQKAGLREFYF